MATVTISGKTLGARRPLFTDFSIQLPAEWLGGARPTLRDLISRVVREEVRAFRQRQEGRQVLRALTSRQIAEGEEKGKVEMGGSDVPVQAVNDDEAIATACQAFEDGLFLVVIDEVDHREIDREIHLQPDSRVTFVRLTMLAGG